MSNIRRPEAVAHLVVMLGVGEFVVYRCRYLAGGKHAVWFVAVVEGHVRQLALENLLDECDFDQARAGQQEGLG